MRERIEKPHHGDWVNKFPEADTGPPKNQRFFRVKAYVGGRVWEEIEFYSRTFVQQATKIRHMAKALAVTLGLLLLMLGSLTTPAAASPDLLEWTRVSIPTDG